MAELIEYERPLPDGYRLRYIINENAVRISRDSVGKGLLWAELCAPLIVLIAFAIAAGVVWRLTEASHVHLGSSTALPIILYGILLVMLVNSGRWAWQN